MRKINIVLIATACAGALITGVGLGVAFADFSSLDYQTYQVPASEKAPTKTAEFTFGDVDEICISGSWRYTKGSGLTVTPDPAVPEYTVRLSAKASARADDISITGPEEITEYPMVESYNAELGGWDYVPDEQHPTKTMYIYVEPVEQEFSWNDYKDTVLDGLKNGVVYSLPSVSEGFTVEVRVNPADVDLVQTNDNW